MRVGAELRLVEVGGDHLVGAARHNGALVPRALLRPAVGRGLVRVGELREGLLKRSLVHRDAVGDAPEARHKRAADGVWSDEGLERDGGGGGDGVAVEVSEPHRKALQRAERHRLLQRHVDGEGNVADLSRRLAALRLAIDISDVSGHLKIKLRPVLRGEVGIRDGGEGNGELTLLVRNRLAAEHLRRLAAPAGGAAPEAPEPRRAGNAADAVLNGGAAEGDAREAGGRALNLRLAADADSLRGRLHRHLKARPLILLDAEVRAAAVRFEGHAPREARQRGREGRLERAVVVGGDGHRRALLVVRVAEDNLQRAALAHAGRRGWGGAIGVAAVGGLDNEALEVDRLAGPVHVAVEEEVGARARVLIAPVAVVAADAVVHVQHVVSDRVGHVEVLTARQRLGEINEAIDVARGGPHLRRRTLRAVPLSLSNRGADAREGRAGGAVDRNVALHLISYANLHHSDGADEDGGDANMGAAGGVGALPRDNCVVADGGDGREDKLDAALEAIVGGALEVNGDVRWRRG